jgi:hypothetical protein
MFRIKHLISTAAVLVVSAGVLAPAAQAKPVIGQHGQVAIAHVSHFRDAYPGPIHDTPLANPVQQPVVVTGRTIRTSGGVDWTFPVMGAVALGLIFMIAGDQLLFRRRGQLAT